MSKVKSTFFGGAEKRAGGIQAEAGQQSAAEFRKQIGAAEERLDPNIQAGFGALEQQQGLLGLLGPQEISAGLTAFAESPGQVFLREEQERGLLRSSSAIGGLGGGNIRTALQQQAFGRAATQLGTFQDRLAGLSGQGQTAATNLSSLGIQGASGISQGLQQAAAGRASGIVGQAAGEREGITQVAQFSDSRLKTNIQKVDELTSGLGWYVWDWTEEAKPIVGDQVAEGVIAQEAIKLFPEAIGSIEGFMAVDYMRIH